MSTLPALPDKAPDYMAMLADSCPDLISVSNEMMGGLTVSAPPTISTKGTRFVLKVDGKEEVIDASSINVVVLKSRPGLTKKYYVNKYVPGQEPQAPDCSSTDGIKPDGGDLRQHPTCAGCPQNVFGTSTAADGSAGKGKACTDAKTLAVLYKGGIYQLNIPPMSLKNFGGYCKLLASRDLFVPAVMTRVSFDPAQSFAVFLFDYAGTLDEKSVRAVVEKIHSRETAEIINGMGGNTTPALAAPAPKPALPAPPEPVAPVSVSVGLEDDGEANFPDPPKAAEVAKPKAPAKPKAAPTPAQAAATTAAPSQAELADELGLDM